MAFAPFCRNIFFPFFLAQTWWFKRMNLVELFRSGDFLHYEDKTLQREPIGLCPHPRWIDSDVYRHIRPIPASYMFST